MGKEYKRETYVKGLMPDLGRVQFMEDFEESMKFTVDGSEGVAMRRTIENKYKGSTSLELTGSVGQSEDEENIAVIRLPPIWQGRNAVEMMFRIESVSKVKYFSIEIIYYTGAKLIRAFIRYVRLTHKWQYYDEAGNYIDITGANLGLLSESWQRIRIEIDMYKKEYIKLSVSGGEYDLRGKKMYSQDSPTEAKTEFKLVMYSRGTGAMKANYDCMLVEVY